MFLEHSNQQHVNIWNIRRTFIVFLWRKRLKRIVRIDEKDYFDDR